MREMLCLQWNDFQENLKSAFVSLIEDEDFAHVTLACEDDTFFQKLFGRNQQTYSAEQEVGGSADDDCEECVEENFNCLRIPPLLVEERLPRCDTWEEFLEGQKEGLVVAVSMSRETKDLSKDSFGPGVGGREGDQNDNIVLDVSPSEKLPIDSLESPVLSKGPDLLKPI